MKNTIGFSFLHCSEIISVNLEQYIGKSRIVEVIHRFKVTILYAVRCLENLINKLCLNLPI